MAYGARALGSRSFRSSERTGKPSTWAARSQRSPTAKGSRFPNGKDAEVREKRRAETFLNMIPGHGVDPGEGNKGNWRAGCGESVRRVTHRRNCHQRWPEFRANDSEVNN